MSWLIELIVALVKMLLGKGERYEVEAEVSKCDPDSDSRSDALDVWVCSNEQAARAKSNNGKAR